LRQNLFDHIRRAQMAAQLLQHDSFKEAAQRIPMEPTPAPMF
jgi:hypothetical protein